MVDAAIGGHDARVLLAVERARVGAGGLAEDRGRRTAATAGQRIAAQGYSYSTWGENIAAGYTTAASAVNGWMNSEGHRNNILNCNFKETGVGYYYLANDTGNENWYRYWTQVFASP